MEGKIECLNLCENSNILLIGIKANILSFDLNSFKIIQTNSYHSDTVLNIVINFDETLIASSSLDKNLVIWDAKQEVILKNIKNGIFQLSYL